MEQYVIRGGRAGYDRLQVLARSWAPTTEALLDRAGVRPDMRCVDLGCGAGDVTFALAGRVGPQGAVVGVDMDAVKLDLAGAEAQRLGLGSVTFVVSDVYAWAEESAYDVAYCRNVLQHLSRPVDLLRAMWASLRPGGVIVVEDADFDGSFCHPADAGFDFWRERYQQVLIRHGGDPLSGRKLHERFVQAGIPAPELTVVQRVDTDGEAKRLPYLTVEATADAMVSQGVATAEEVTAALDALTAFADDPATVVGSPRLFQAWSRHP